MLSTLAQGTRLYYAASATAWVTLAAGSYPTTGFTEVTRGLEVDVTPMVVEDFDESCLNSLTDIPNQITKSGSATLGREKDSASAAIRGLCDGTQRFFAIVYPDGTAETAEGKITPATVKASKGFTTKVNEAYKIQAVEKFTLRPHA